MLALTGWLIATAAQIRPCLSSLCERPNRKGMVDLDTLRRGDNIEICAEWTEKAQEQLGVYDSFL